MVFQGNPTRDHPDSMGEEEWQIVSTKWWRTPFSSVSWSYNENAPRNVIFSKPPHYHLSLHSEQALRSFDNQGCEPESSHSLHEWSSALKVADDTVLNEELIGVKNACEVLKAYEEAVGFNYSPWPSLRLKDLEKRRIGDVSEKQVQLGKERWTEFVNDLVGGKSLKQILKEARDSTKNVLQRTFATPNKMNYFSQPSAPKPFQLNPSASSFVPHGSPTSTLSSSSCSSSSLDSPDPLGPFSFSSSAASPPSPLNRQDHQDYVKGFHTHCHTVNSDGSFAVGLDRPSSEFLPSFLFDAADQRRRPLRASRTRAMIDRLRSQLQYDEDQTSPTSQIPSPSVSDFGICGSGYFKPRLTISDESSTCSITPPLTEEDFHHRDRVSIGSWTDNLEGWPAPAVVDQETKRTRSKELLMTLRRRTDSLTSNTNAVVNSVAGAMSASTSPALVASEILVESPEPVEAVDSLAEELSEKSNQIADFRDFSALGDRRAGAQSISPEVNHINTLSRDEATIRNLSPVHSRIHPQADNSTRYSHRVMNSNSGVSYPLFGHPLPVSSMRVPARVSTMGAPRTRFPVQIPIKVPMRRTQYSTLMHLRIMQQMQMMRNNMNVVSVSGTSTYTG